MTRRALLYSLVLHAGFLVLVGGWSPSTTMHAGPGDPGAGVSFLSELPGSPLLVEATPAPEPEDEEPIAEPPAVEPKLDPPLPVAPVVAAPVANIPREEFQPMLPAFPAKSNRNARNSAVSAASKATGRKAGADTKGSGTSLAGSGRGGGGPGYVPPQFRIRYKPPYPEEARAQRLQGTVLLLVKVDADGRVTDAGIRQSCGHPLLDRAAVEAVRAWRFYPARQDGTPIAAQVEVPVSFRFEERRLASR